jgi:hypothetical protein
MRTLLSSVVLAATLALVACSDSVGSNGAPDLSQSGTAPGTHRQYGTPVKLGGGQARSYIVLDAKNGGAPLELGVAFDERAMDGLPAPMQMPPQEGGDAHAHVDSHEYILPLPAQNPTPFKLVELDWNPQGHEAPGVYDIPHFDFHFYTITKAERDAILPTDPQYAAKANNMPAAEFIPPFVALPLPPGVPPVTSAVPRMGVHMLDMRSPEIQGMLGRPELFKPFTTTFIHGAWDGKVTFFEPMITRAYIMGKKAETDPAKRDEIIALPTAQRYSPAGYYPSAYRITWDAQAKEYRIALTQLAARN